MSAYHSSSRKNALWAFFGGVCLVSSWVQPHIRVFGLHSLSCGLRKCNHYCVCSVCLCARACVQVSVLFCACMQMLYGVRVCVCARLRGRAGTSVWMHCARCATMAKATSACCCARPAMLATTTTVLNRRWKASVQFIFCHECLPVNDPSWHAAKDLRLCL